MSLDYKVTPTLAHFHQSDAFCRFVVGPYGSGKTHAMIMETLKRSAQQAPDKHGIRRTRVAIVRNTLQQLKQSVLPDSLDLLEDLNVNFKVSENVLQIRFGDIYSDWIFLPMEDLKDQRRLLSLPLTFAWLAEFRELDYDTVSALTGRIGRYPSKKISPPTWIGLYGESNPFSEDSPWYEHLVLNLPASWRHWKQPGGLDPEAENVENLPPNYYERMSEGKSQDWINVHVHSQYGDSVAGQAVFRRAFNPSVHVSTQPLHPNALRPVMIGFDFERHPAAVFGQIDNQGRTVVFAECHADNMGPFQFAQKHVMPLIAQRFPRCRFFVVGDPSGATRVEQMAGAEITDVDVFQGLNALGLAAYPATTNLVEPRLLAVEQQMLRNQLLIDGHHCPDLVRALRFEYRFKRKKTDGELDDRPEKRHPWSDLADALQYLCLGAGADYPGWYLRDSGLVRHKATPPPPGALGQPPTSVAAWT